MANKIMGGSKAPAKKEPVKETPRLSAEEINQQTRVFKLLSGVECEITKLRGEHQELLTQKENLAGGKGMNMMLADVIVRLGSDTSINLTKVKGMLSADRKRVLLELRDFSMSRHRKFSFLYKWKDAKEVEHKELMEMDFVLADFPGKPYKFKATEYHEIWGGKHTLQEIHLIDLNKTVVWSPLTGNSEEIVSVVPEGKRSSHTIIQARNPRYKHTTRDNKETLIDLNLHKLTYDDIEDLSLAFKAIEGVQDTTMIYTSPETGKEEEVDITQIPAFFFPSLAL